MTSAPVPHITIIGDGFAGAMTTYHLARLARRPLTVDLVGDAPVAGLGVAYGTADPSHLLNVAAGRMSALPDVEDDFLQWLRRESPRLETGAFVPRMRFGRYVAERLDNAIRESVHARVRKVVARVVAIRDRRAQLADGSLLPRSDAIVLALGNAAPDVPPGIEPALAGSTAYIASPWDRSLDRVGPRDSILIIGTGLTMYDVVLSLRARGHAGRIVALSRRGLLPQTHRTPSLPPGRHEHWPELANWDGRVLSLSRLVRARVRQAQARGVDWREVINSLRPITQQLWARFDLRQRRAFLRHLRPFWETHRHRAPDEVFRAVEPLLRDGTLRVLAGRIVRASLTPTGAEVVVAPRDADGPSRATISASFVVNCTGPQTDPRRIPDPLVRDLIARGAVTPDPLGLGIETAPDGAVIGSAGTPSPGLFSLGPWRRPALWETTAVPEIRGQARDLATTLLATLDRASPH